MDVSVQISILNFPPAGLRDQVCGRDEHHLVLRARVRGLLEGRITAKEVCHHWTRLGYVVKVYFDIFFGDLKKRKHRHSLDV